MSSITADDLKKHGVAAIEAALTNDSEAVKLQPQKPPSPRPSPQGAREVFSEAVY